MKDIERYGTTVDGIEWEIDLEGERMICTEKPNIIRKLNKNEVDQLRRQINKVGS